MTPRASSSGSKAGLAASAPEGSTRSARCSATGAWHFEQARYAGPHAPGVNRGLPIGELHRMARAARLRLEAPLDGREARWRQALRRNGGAPVLRDEIALAGGEPDPRKRRVGRMGGGHNDGERHDEQDHEPGRRCHASRAYHAPFDGQEIAPCLAPSEPGDTLGPLESRVVGSMEASRIPVGLPDFKSGVRL